MALESNTQTTLSAISLLIWKAEVGSVLSCLVHGSSGIPGRCGKTTLHAKLGCDGNISGASDCTLMFLPQFRGLRSAEVHPNVPSTILRVPLLPNQHPKFHIEGPARLWL